MVSRLGEERSLSAVVLAAGEGTRMVSERPKPLHRLSGRPMVLHVLDALAQLKVSRVVVVVGHRGEWVSKFLVANAPDGLSIEIVEQASPRGTGDAVAVGLTAFPEGAFDDDGDVIVVPGDTPLLRPGTLSLLVEHHRETSAAATLVASVLGEPTGWDRVVRGKNDSVVRVVEQDEVEAEHMHINEVATAIHCFRLGVLPAALRRLRPVGPSREHPLSGIYEVLHDAGYGIATCTVEDHMEVVGVNDRSQLAIAEAELRRRINERWMKLGVTMWDPDRTYIDASVRFGRDVVILPGVVIQGDSYVGTDSEIGPDSRLIDTFVGKGVTFSNSVATQAAIGDGAIVGPFSVLAPDSQVPEYGKVAPHALFTAEQSD